jgi:hypothetical protein
LICGKKIGGIVGMDFLKRYIVQLDFDNGEIFFLKSETNSKSEWGEEFNLKFLGSYPSIDIKFQDIPITFSGDEHLKESQLSIEF